MLQGVCVCVCVGGCVGGKEQGLQGEAEDQGGKGGAAGCPASGLPHRQRHTICSMLSVISVPTSHRVMDSSDEQGEEH